MAHASVPDFKSWSLAEVARHGSEDDGWIAQDGYVYDVTHLVSRRLALSPRQAAAVASLLPLLGTDATDRPEPDAAAGGRLSNFLVGQLVGHGAPGSEGGPYLPPPEPAWLPPRQGARKWTMAEVARHNDIHDGWVAIGAGVYDITRFIETHPGWNNSGQVSTTIAIARALGKDATEEFSEIHSHTAWGQLRDFRIGSLAREGDPGADAGSAPEHPEPAWLEGQTAYMKLHAQYKTPDELLADMRAREREAGELKAARAGGGPGGGAGQGVGRGTGRGAGRWRAGIVGLCAAAVPLVTSALGRGKRRRG